MRKIFSICFIVLLLMNVMGYYAIFLGVRVQHENMMEEKLAFESFRIQDLVYIQIPISIPYAQDETDFSPVDGRFEHEGEVFHLLKQRYASDTMTFVCVRDARAGQINAALTNYVKSFADDHSTGAKASMAFSFIKDYISSPNPAGDYCPSLVSDVLKRPVDKHFTNSYMAEIVHPPWRQLHA